MKTSKILITTMVITITALFSSCKKDGAVGPIGPQGTPGTNGTNGINGTNGTNGVANISSTMITIPPSSWNTIGAGAVYGIGFIDTAIVNADADGIEVFYKQTAFPPTYRSLPSPNLIANGDQLIYFYGQKKIDFYYYFTSAPTIPVVFKVVVIPPAIRQQHPNTNWKDYSQINALINLQKNN